MTPFALVERSLAARQRAYAPYSGYAVGAALLCIDGTVVEGCNVENASFGATICAERVALTAAVAQGQRSISAIAIATRDGGMPCGICRQVMAELGPEMTVYVTDQEGIYRTFTMDDILPHRFYASSLG
jgi:cytidine deaminase